MRVGYARASARDQKLEVQLGRLADCDPIFSEKASGKNTARPELTKCLEYVRGGDVLVVTKLDRLARSVQHLIEITQLLERKKVDLVVLDQQIDTSTLTGKLLFHILAAIAEFEHGIRAERIAEGLEAAKAAGRLHTTPFKLSAAQVEQLRERHGAGESVGALARAYKLDASTIYRYLRRGDGVAS
jgi:DNA invertase Pin-like site-specific DNA recombinase